MRFDLFQRNSLKVKAPQFNFLSDETSLWVESEQQEEEKNVNHSFLQGMFS